MSDSTSLLSYIWRHPRGQVGLAFAGLGIVLFFFAGKDLLRDPSNEFARWIIYIGVSFVLAGALLVCIVSYHGKNALALRAGASTVRGRVMSVKKDWLSRGYALHYSFVDSIGRSYRGEKILSQQEAFTWRDGEEGEVRYDPNEPRKNVWIGRGIDFEQDESAATCVGTVTEVIEQDLDGKKQSVVHYRYRDHIGEFHEDKFVQNESTFYKTGDRGRVEFHLQHPGLNQWSGKTEDPGPDAGTSEADVSPNAYDEVANVDPESAPSTSQLLRRSKSLWSAGVIFVYFLITGFFLLLFMVQERPSWNNTIAVGLYLLVAGLFVWFIRKLVLSVREVKSWKRILTTGAPARATVSLIEEKRQQLGRFTWTPGWIVSYRYSDKNGRVHSGESGYISRKEAARWRSRDKCVILYDSEQPEKSVWIGGT